MNALLKISLMPTYVIYQSRMEPKVPRVLPNHEDSACLVSLHKKLFNHRLSVINERPLHLRSMSEMAQTFCVV